MLHVRPTLRLLCKAIPCHHGHIKPPKYQHHRNLLTLAIETSCDDTAVAILEKDDRSSTDTAATTYNKPAKARLLFNEKITAPNTGLGGIHPLEALDSHQTNLAKLIAKAVKYLPDAQSPSASSTSPSNQSHSHQRTITINVDGDRSKGSDKSVVTKQLPDFISVTRGPGMRSNLHCGLDTAKGLSAAWSVPLLGVHHMQAHALTPRLVDALTAPEHTTSANSTVAATDSSPMSPPHDGASKPPGSLTQAQVQTQQVSPSSSATASSPATTFPFLTLLISGGHTLLLHSTSLTSHSIIASTADVAIGDALDKCGRCILPHSITSTTSDTAFAKHLSDFAFPDTQSYRLWKVPRRRADEIEKTENEWGWTVPTPFADTREMGFSFTSIASTVEGLVRGREKMEQKQKQRSGDGEKVDGKAMNDGTSTGMSLEERQALGRAAIGTAFEHLASRTVIALQTLRAANQPISSLVVSGGVAANPFLRYFLRAMLDVRGFEHVRLVFPPPWLCTDNAAMIAWCGMEMFEAGYRSELGIGALRKWSMDPAAADGGILGVGGWVKASGS